jgi:hypothetical protein
MAVNTETPALQSAPKAAGARSTRTRAPRAARAAGTPEPQRTGRRLSPAERAVLQTMIAEAEAMRRRLTAAG